MSIYCQFRNFNTSNNYIFNDMRLKLGKISESNDPVEIKTLNATNETISSILDEDNYNYELNAYLNSILKMTCFTVGDYDFEEGGELLKADIERAPFFKPKMWALYGSNERSDNAGICIVFNESILDRFSQLEDDYIIHDGMIRYDNFLDEMISGTFSYNTDVTIPEPKSDSDIKNTVHTYLENNYQDIYMTKDEDWKQENEHRLLCWNKISTPSHSETYLDFEPEDVEAVILGYNISKNPDYKDFIRNLLTKNIPVYKLGLLQNIPAIQKIYDENDDELKGPTFELFHKQKQAERKRLLGEAD